MIVLVLLLVLDLRLSLRIEDDDENDTAYRLSSRISLSSYAPAYHSLTSTRIKPVEPSRVMKPLVQPLAG